MITRNDLDGVATKASLLLIFWLAVSSAQTTNSASCNFYQELILDNTYYIYNVQFPNDYRGAQSCTWTMKSDYRVNLTCTVVQMPWSLGCFQDKLTVQLNSTVTKQYCGNGAFSVQSTTNTMVVTLQSPFWSSGGRFLCEAQAVKNPKESENCRCGWKNPTRIVGGTETGVNEFPMMAGIFDSVEKEIFCGATIIASQYVLTAGHCLENREYSELGVVVGEHDVDTGTDTNATRVFKLSQVIVHPNYVSGGRLNDIAVLKINGVIQYNARVGPVCLPFQHAEDSFAGNFVDILGWGLTEFGGPRATTLQKAALSVITNLNCSRTYPDVSSKQLCTYAPGKDSCQMDSGGPVLWQNPTTQNVVHIGIISNGIACGIYPGVNQRTGSYVNWIVSVTPDATYCVIE